MLCLHQLRSRGRLRVGIDYSPAVNQQAGIGRYTRSIVAELAELDQENEYVLFYPSRNLNQEVFAPPKSPNFQRVEIPVSNQSLNALWFRLGVPFPVDLFTGPVDVCHFPDFTLPPIRNGKTVLTVHDLSFLVHPEYAEKGLRQYLERVVPPSVAGASLVLADSESTGNDLIVLLDVPPERVEVLLPGVEPRFAPVVDEVALESARRKYSISFPYILTISTIEPRKNLLGLMKAFSGFKRMTESRHKLVIGGGKGWHYSEVFATAKAIDVADDIIFLGHVADEDLPALYSMSDLFAWLSFYEGFGLPVLEAMACGTPVVASNRASLPEVIGDAGLLVPPSEIDAIADAFDSILGDEALAAELADKGRKQASLFSWRSSAKQLLSIYQRLASDN